MTSKIELLLDSTLHNDLQKMAHTFNLIDVPKSTHVKKFDLVEKLSKKLGNDYKTFLDNLVVNQLRSLARNLGIPQARKTGYVQKDFLIDLINSEINNLTVDDLSNKLKRLPPKYTKRSESPTRKTTKRSQSPTRQTTKRSASPTRKTTKKSASPTKKTTKRSASPTTKTNKRSESPTRKPNRNIKTARVTRKVPSYEKKKKPIKPYSKYDINDIQKNHDITSLNDYVDLYKLGVPASILEEYHLKFWNNGPEFTNNIDFEGEPLDKAISDYLNNDSDIVQIIYDFEDKETRGYTQSERTKLDNSTITLWDDNQNMPLNPQ
jgi:hypothetical protein